MPTSKPGDDADLNPCAAAQVTIKTSMTKISRSLPLFCVACYLLLASGIFLHILKKNSGHFTYALDDPYIHLAMAENLAHGHYGINPTEFSSPSSSIVWPFLLVPFAGTALHLYVPLIWNVIFSVIAAYLIGWTIARWPSHTDERNRMPWWQQALTAVLLLLVADLASLTMVGMEHVLQVLLAICCAIGLIEALSERPIPWWCLAAAVVAPSVRYEDLALTLAVAIVLAGAGRWKQASLVFGLSLAPLLAFSFFLKSMGLPLLPMSVLVKGNAFAHVSTATKIFLLVRGNIFRILTMTQRMPIAILCLTFAALAWSAPTRLRRYIFGAAATLGALQLGIGRFGWFPRYEVYALIFLVLLCLRVLAEGPRFLAGYYVLGLVFCASFYIQATAETAAASYATYQQQYQMHRFVTSFYHGDYAVNDLGLMSFQRPPGVYVLDLFGLASVEASQQTDKSAAWMEDVTKRHHIPLAIVYPLWFDIPSTWVPLAKMCVLPMSANLGDQCVNFYSTSSDTEAVAKLRAELIQFASTLPHDIPFYLGQLPSEDLMWKQITGPLPSH